MAYPQSLREKMGVSQAVFANLIGCTKSVLSMVELGQRNLPTASLEIVLLLEQTIVQVDTDKLSIEPKSSDIDTKKLQNLLAKAQQQLNNRQHELAKLDEQIIKWLQLQQMQQLLNDAAFEKDTVSALQWGVLQRKAVTYLQKAQEERILLHINIAALQAEIEALESFI